MQDGDDEEFPIPKTRDRRATVYRKAKMNEKDFFRNTTADIVKKLNDAGLVTDMW